MENWDKVRYKLRQKTGYGHFSGALSYAHSAREWKLQTFGRYPSKISFVSQKG